MAIKKEFEQGNLVWCINYQKTNDSDKEVIQGTLDLEISNPEELDYPVRLGVQLTNDYTQFNKTSAKIHSPSKTKEKFSFDVVESGDSYREEDDNETHPNVWFSDDGEFGENHRCAFVPKEVASLCIELTNNELADDELIDKLSKEHNVENKPVAYIGLRDKSRFCTEFSTHVKLLDKLYENTQIKNQDRFDFSDDMFNFIRDYVIETQGGNKAYPAKSKSDLRDKINFCSSRPNLPNISDENVLVGLYLIKKADDLVHLGKFNKAKARTSEAIELFEQSDSSEALPAKLKRAAITGLTEESKCNFEKAAEKYSDAADQAESERNKDAYHAWSTVAKAKQQLNNGNIDSAKRTINETEYDHSQIHIVDLKKLTVLFGLYADYMENNSLNANDVFNEVDYEVDEVPDTDAIIQYDIDYSAGFSMLITKHRRRQLGIDPGINDDFLMIMRDAITPKGISKNEPETDSTDQNSDQGGDIKNSRSTGQQSEGDFERNYTETKRAQRDVQFQKNVKEVYNQSCAVCGSQRKTPDGRPEVEAAHIRPVSEGGQDIITNGIALCKLHHWAFDNGWITIDKNYSIVVRDMPEMNGYDDFIKHRGESINLPESEDKRPDSQFLKFHRQEHNLNAE